MKITIKSGTKTEFPLPHNTRVWIDYKELNGIDFIHFNVNDLDEIVQWSIGMKGENWVKSFKKN